MGSPERSPEKGRALMMTSFAFILGLLPLEIAEGGGSAIRRDVGLAVFSGTIAVSTLGIFLIPTLHVVFQRPAPRVAAVPDVSDTTALGGQDDREAIVRHRGCETASTPGLGPPAPRRYGKRSYRKPLGSGPGPD